jgi:outer membrane biosynthesis protein TonB
MPQFKGGDAALMDYLNKNIKYPVIAEENGIQGRVITTFVVERDGSKFSGPLILLSTGKPFALSGQCRGGFLENRREVLYA